MKNDRKRVMEKLVGQCLRAYQMKTPLIVIDTEEIELVRRLAWQLANEGNFVDLLQKRVERM